MPQNAFPAHPLRARLHAEIHARPAEPAKAPLSVSRLVTLAGEAGAEAERAALAALCARFAAPAPAPGARWHAVDLGPCRLRWERHTELSAYTITRALDPGSAPFTATALAGLPEDWAAGLPGQLLVGLHLEARGGEPTLEGAAAAFATPAFAASATTAGTAIATDFQLGADGFSRMLVWAPREDPAGLGRTLQAAMEIETYRIAALLAFPEALAARDALGRLEEDLVAAMGELAAQAEDDGERALLARLTALAAQAEALAARTSYRFAAGRAYHGLVEERIAGLAERALWDRPTLGAFLARRLAPAMRTCDAVGERQQALLERIARATRLLATRVDVAMEEQNARLLASMNARTRAQLRLQETVEGLSVVAVSYYAVGLVGYAAKGLHAFGLELDASVVTGLATPFVVGFVWLGLARLKKALTHDGEH